MSDQHMQFINEMFDYYNRDIRGGAAKTYMRMLVRFPIDQLQRVYFTHLTDPDQGQFMPKIADFVRVLEGTKKGQSTVAWNKVDRAIREVGPYGSICFDDQIIHKVIEEMGGWISICDTPTEKDLDFKMHQFNRLYEMYKGQGGVTDYPKRLNGIVDAENKTSSDPLLIGNPSKAKQVHDSGGDRRALTVTRMDQLTDKLLN